MATLTTTAVIRAHDQLTGPLGTMASKVNAISGRFAGGARRMGAAGQSLGIGMAGGAYGFSALLDKAEEFNKNIFGIGVANLNSVDGAVKGNGVERSLADMKRMEETSMKLSRELGMSVTAISGIEETLAKAGMSGENLDAVARAAATLSKTDLETPANSMADFLHTLSVIQKPQKGEGFGSFIKTQADMVFAAAAETKLSVGSIMEGMKQFQTIGAGMGLGTEDMLAMLMAGAQRGFSATEFGTALKSDLIRLIKPTAEGQAALSRLGINKNDKQFTDSTAVGLDPTRALSNLNRAVGGGLEGNVGKAIKTKLFDGQKNDTTHTDTFLSDLTRYIAKKKGIKNLDDVQALRQSIESSVLTTNGSLNAPKLLAELVRKGATDADLASVFEGRQLSRNKALIDAIRSGEYDQSVQMLKRMKGQGLDNVETLWSKSALGNVKAMEAAWQRLGVSLANSPGLQKFVNLAERAADSLGKVNPQIVEMALAAAGLGMIGKFAVGAVGGLLQIGGAGLMAGKAMGSLLALPFLRAASGLRGLSIGLGAVSMATGVAMGGTTVARVSKFVGALAPLARFAGPLALVAAGFAVFQNWDSISGFFDKLANSESVEKAGMALSRLGSALAPVGNFFSWIGTKIGDMVDSLQRLVGMDPSQGVLMNGIGFVIDKFTALVDWITRAVKAFNEFTGLTEKKNVTPGGTVATEPTYRPADGSFGDMSGAMDGAVAFDFSPINASAYELSGGAVSLQQAATMLQSLPGQIVGAIQGITIAPTINVSGGGGASSPGKATAPAPRVSNGPQYNGGN